MSTKLTEFENAQVGMWVGIIEVLCLQPFNYAKNMIQQGQPLTLNPAKLYRGVGANVVNMGSCTMIQFAVGGSLKKAIIGDDKSRKLLVHEEMGAGILAGIVSALVGSPLELIMIRQQRRGLNTIATVKDILTQSPANLGRGYFGAAVREGLWTCGYLSIPPIMRAELTTRFPETFDSQAKARVPASLLGGLFACYLTHPFDTVKTCMQGDIERAKFGTFTQTAKVVYGESGFFGFYRGASFRYGRMVIAVGMMDYLQSIIGPFMYPNPKIFKKYVLEEPSVTCEVLMFFLSLVVGTGAAILLSGRVYAIQYPVTRLAWSIASIAFLLSLCTVYACIGAKRQIERRSCCFSGRRILCVHQMIVFAIALYLSKVTYTMNQTHTSISNTIEAMTVNSSTFRYDAFELKLSKVFNEEYRFASCANNKNTLSDWVDKACPKYTTVKCSPESICTEETCPYYDMCRMVILKNLSTIMIPTIRICLFLSLLMTGIVILSCLLICYNPRDDIEIDLMKTGVMTEEDVELIRRLRSEHKFDYERQGSFIDLDSLRNRGTDSHPHVNSLIKPELNSR